MSGRAALSTTGKQQTAGDPTTKAIMEATPEPGAERLNEEQLAKIRQRIADTVALAELDRQDAEAAVIDADRAAHLAMWEAAAQRSAQAKAERDAKRAEIMARL